MESSDVTKLRTELLYVLYGSGARLSFSAVVQNVPFEKVGIRPSHAAHSIWEVCEHMRIIQWDLIESRSSSHVSPKWPEGYWPATVAPADPAAWEECLRRFSEDLDRLCSLVSDPAVDLFGRADHPKEQTLVRDILLAADHNTYHCGEIVLLRRLLDCWPA